MTAGTSPSRAAARARADTAWADLRDRLRTVTPSALGRASLAIVVALVVGAVTIGTWPALLPFLVGGLIAYAALPIVDALDRLMPRALAATLAMIGILAVIVAVLAIVVPPLVSALIELSTAIPGAAELESRIRSVLESVPEDARIVIAPVVLAVVHAAVGALAGATASVDDLVPAVLQAALGVVGAFLGLLVLPAWMLTLLTEKQRSALAVERHTAGWLRPDLWAIVRLLDRALGTYLRGYVVVAFLVGVATFIGLTLSERLGGPVYQGELALATFAGAAQVIPEVGPIFGLLPVLLLLPIDPQRAGMYLLVYVVSRVLVGRTIGDRLMEGRLHVPPIVLIPGVVALGQFGLLWLLVSAPILAFATDLVRYLHGRLSEPPRPAGLLPDDPLPVSPVAIAGGRPVAPVVPAVYRSRVTGGMRASPGATTSTPGSPPAVTPTPSSTITR